MHLHWLLFQVLGEVDITVVTNQAERGEVEEISKVIDSIVDAVCQLTKVGAQAAYLVGIAYPNSSPAIPGLVGQKQIIRASEVRK